MCNHQLHMFRGPPAPSTARSDEPSGRDIAGGAARAGVHGTGVGRVTAFRRTAQPHRRRFAVTATAERTCPTDGEHAGREVVPDSAEVPALSSRRLAGGGGVHDGEAAQNPGASRPRRRRVAWAQDARLRLAPRGRHGGRGDRRDGGAGPPGGPLGRELRLGEPDVGHRVEAVLGLPAPLHAHQPGRLDARAQGPRPRLDRRRHPGARSHAFGAADGHLRLHVRDHPRRPHGLPVGPTAGRPLRLRRVPAPADHRGPQPAALGGPRRPGRPGRVRRRSDLHRRHVAGPVRKAAVDVGAGHGPSGQQALGRRGTAELPGVLLPPARGQAALLGALLHRRHQLRARGRGRLRPAQRGRRPLDSSTSASC